eukprot:2607627-Pleurochrysis_carterae.AAC.1
MADSNAAMTAAGVPSEACAGRSSASGGAAATSLCGAACRGVVAPDPSAARFARPPFTRARSVRSASTSAVARRSICESGDSSGACAVDAVSCRRVRAGESPPPLLPSSPPPRRAPPLPSSPSFAVASRAPAPCPPPPPPASWPVSRRAPPAL